jgi:hypothetical protein
MPVAGVAVKVALVVAQVSWLALVVKPAVGRVVLCVMATEDVLEQPLAVLVTVTVNEPAAATVAVFVPDTAVAPALQL